MIVAACGGQTFDYAEVEQAARDGRLAQAARQLEERARAAPDDCRSRILLGSVYASLRRNAEAIEQYRFCAAAHPGDPSPHVNLGRLLAAEGRLPEARSELETAVRLAPRDPAAAGHLGRVLAAQKEYAAALAVLERASALAPRDASILFECFQAELALKRFDAAAATQKRILESSPASLQVLNQLGSLQAAAGDYPHATANFERASALEPKAYEPKYNLALAYFRGGDAARALAVLDPLRHEPGGAEVENLAGDVLESLGKYVDAARAFQKAAELVPKNEDYRFDFIYELLRHQTYDAAMLVAERSLADFPVSLRLRLALGVAYFGAEQYGKAREALIATARAFPQSETALHVLVFAAEASREKLEETEALVDLYRAAHPERSLPYYLLGRLALIRGDSRQAAPLLLKSVQLNSQDAEAEFECGKAFDGAGEKRQAVEHYVRAVRLKPDLAQAHYRLSQAYQGLGQSKEARAALARFRELHEHEGEASPVVKLLYELR